MELILNELCLGSQAADIYAARALMEQFSHTARAAMRAGCDRVLRVHRAFWSELLAPNYTVGAWGNDAAVDIELRRSIRSLAGRSPFLDEMADADGALSETSCEGRRGLGVTVAVHLDASVCSLANADGARDPLPVTTGALEADGTWVSTTAEVPNLFSPEVVARRSEWISSRAREEVANGADLLRRRTDLLSRIDLCEGAAEQLRSLNGTESVFRPVVRHLCALSDRAGAWTTGTFESGYLLPCSQESESTMNKYSEERTFRCPDGRTRTFSWHSKINIDKWRVYFVADPETRRVTVGYIGRHLRITSTS